MAAALTKAKVLSINALMPKSVILASPCRLNRTFAGLMSLCTYAMQTNSFIPTTAQLSSARHLMCSSNPKGIPCSKQQLPWQSLVKAVAKAIVPTVRSDGKLALHTSRYASHMCRLAAQVCYVAGLNAALRTIHGTSALASSKL